MTATRVVSLCIWIVCAGLLGTACNGTRETSASDPATPAAAPQSTGDVVIDFRSEPDPPKSGDNQVEVTVKGKDGAAVTDAQVTTVFSMPAMPSMNMPAMRSDATLAHDADGRYTGTGQLSMSGTWNVTVKVSRGSDVLGSKSFSIVAK